MPKVLATMARASAAKNKARSIKRKSLMANETSHHDIEPSTLVLCIVFAAILLGLIVWMA